MTQESFPLDMEKIKAISSKFKALCQRMDAQIFITQLEEENRCSPLYQYRLNKAKRFLNSNISAKED